MIESSNFAEAGNDMDGSSKENAMLEEHLSSHDEVSNGDFKQLLLKTDPEVILNSKLVSVCGG